MNHPTSRNDRRRNRTRFLKKATDIVTGIWKIKDSPTISRLAVRLHKNRKQCSCQMCCNPRSRGELTMQEQRANLPEQ